MTSVFGVLCGDRFFVVDVVCGVPRHDRVKIRSVVCTGVRRSGPVQTAMDVHLHCYANLSLALDKARIAMDDFSSWEVVLV